MSHPWRSLVMAAALWLGFACAAHAGWVWTKETGWVDPDVMPTKTPKQRYLFGVALLAEGHYTSARRQFRKIIKQTPDSSLAIDSKFQTARALLFERKYKKSFRELTDLLEKYPSSRLDTKVLRTMFKIAKRTMESSPSRAISMFEKVVERNPYGDLADDAQLNIAECYFRQKDYEAAREMYKALLKDYPDSPWAPVAIRRMGECDMRESEYTWNRGKLLPRALESFREYVRKYPNGRDVELAKKKIAELRELQAKNQFDIAEFYLRIKKPGAAAVYMRTIQRQHPTSRWAKLAREGIHYLQSLRVVK